MLRKGVIFIYFFNESNGNSGAYFTFSNCLCGSFLEDVINGGTEKDVICMLEDIIL